MTLCGFVFFNNEGKNKVEKGAERGRDIKVVTLGRESKDLSHSFIRDQRLQEDKGKRRIDIASILLDSNSLFLQSVHLTLTGTHLKHLKMSTR